MVTVFVHIVFGVCLLLSASSSNGKQKAETKQEVSFGFNQEEK